MGDPQAYDPPITTTTTPPPPNFSNPPSGSGSKKKKSSGASAGSRRSARLALERFMIDLRLPRALGGWAYNLMRQGWSMDGISAALYQRKEFKSVYQGIFRKDGSLIVAPQEYLRLSEAFKSIGSQYGLKLSSAQIGKAINNENSIDEFQLKARAAQAVYRNPQLFSTLQRQINERNAERKRLGQSLLPQIKSGQDAINFMIGQGDQEVYDTYEAVAAQSAAKVAGIDISTNRARTIAARTAGVMDFDDLQKRYRAVREQVTLAGPELLSYGVSQTDLEDFNLGLVTRPGVIEKVESAIRNREAQMAATEEQARFGRVETEAGRPVSGPRRQGS